MIKWYNVNITLKRNIGHNDHLKYLKVIFFCLFRVSTLHLSQHHNVLTSNPCSCTCVSVIHKTETSPIDRDRDRTTQSFACLLWLQRLVQLGEVHQSSSSLSPLSWVWLLSPSLSRSSLLTPVPPQVCFHHISRGDNGLHTHTHTLTHIHTHTHTPPPPPSVPQPTQPHPASPSALWLQPLYVMSLRRSTAFWCVCACV